MKTIFVIVFVIILAICFVIDPTPTVVEDMTDKTIEIPIQYCFNRQLQQCSKEKCRLKPLLSQM
jgi:hypothetical protein